MRKAAMVLFGALAVGAVALGAVSMTASAADGVIYVPDDFVPALSDTRATGHYDVVEEGLRVWTQGNTSTDKVAEYVAVDVPLADVDEPSLEYTATTGTTPPGFQLVVDFDGDGSLDGILVGEPTAYGDDWWLNNLAKQFVKDSAPLHTGGSGSDNHGTLDQWRGAFPNAQVQAFGFSLGSGVLGDGVIASIEFAGDTFTFAEHTQLDGPDACKKGGWETSTKPVFKNQGDCVSYFVSSKNK